MASPGISTHYAAKREVMGDLAIAIENVVKDAVPADWLPEVQLAEPPNSEGLAVLVWFKAFDRPLLHVTIRRRIFELSKAVLTASDLVPSIPMVTEWVRPKVNGPYWGFVLRVTDLGDVPRYPKFIIVSHIDLRATNLLRRKLGLEEKEGVL